MEQRLATRVRKLQEPQSHRSAPRGAGLEPIDHGARVIGECFQTYLIAEDKDGLILIDKHAAHERILFNKMRAETDMPQQQLLDAGRRRADRRGGGGESRRGSADIRKAGFSIDPFGENSFAVRSVPAYLDSGDVQSVISELAEKAMNSRATVPDRLDDLIHTVALQSSDQGGQSNNACWSCKICVTVCFRTITCDPARTGRPTTVRLTKYELDKMFKRVNQ